MQTSRVPLPRGRLVRCHFTLLRPYLTYYRIITDARISFDRKAGYEFANVFFPHSLLPKLAMEVPYSPEMEKKIRNMKEKSGTIGINFEIRYPTQTGNSS